MALTTSLAHDASTLTHEGNVYIRPLSVTVAFVGALPQHLVDTKVVSRSHHPVARVTDHFTAVGSVDLPP